MICSLELDLYSLSEFLSTNLYCLSNFLILNRKDDKMSKVKKIMVATDFSENSIAAAQNAAG